MRLQPLMALQVPSISHDIYIDMVQIFPVYSLTSIPVTPIFELVPTETEMKVIFKITFKKCQSCTCSRYVFETCIYYKMIYQKNQKGLIWVQNKNKKKTKFEANIPPSLFYFYMIRRFAETCYSINVLDSNIYQNTCVF